MLDKVLRLLTLAILSFSCAEEETTLWPSELVVYAVDLFEIKHHGANRLIPFR